MTEEEFRKAVAAYQNELNELENRRMEKAEKRRSSQDLAGDLEKSYRSAVAHARKHGVTVGVTGTETGNETVAGADMDAGFSL